ncbi:MAG: asparaginase [Clostridiales bacterium]
METELIHKIFIQWINEEVENISQVLLHIYRGSIIENMIHGDIAVLDPAGNLLKALGDANKLTYMRSCAKPLQAALLVEKGIMEYFSLTDRELAIICGSHNAEDFHVEAIYSILNKIGLQEENLLCGKDYSYNEALKEKMLVQGQPKRSVYNNCSGKHSGILALCQKEGWDISSYFLPDHPVQQAILENISYYTDLPSGDIGIGVDGCGVPVFAMPLAKMALAYSRLINSSSNNQANKSAKKQAAERIVKAMTSYPPMVAGTGEFCTALLAAGKGDILAKKGSDGVYCCAVKDGPAIALKLEDGNMKYLPLVMTEILNQLDILNHQQKQALSVFDHWDNLNCRGEVIGKTETVFTLK